MSDIRQTTITNLTNAIAALNADLIANPVPATTVPAAPAPAFIKIPFTQTALNDYFVMLKAGASITWGPTSVDFQPPASASTTANGTSSVLLNTPLVSAQNFKLRMTGVTEKQLRTSGPAKAWECLWVLFNFHMGSDGLPAFNYMAFKPTGLEIGTGFSGTGQTFLYTSAAPNFPINQTFSVEIDKQASVFSVLVNGVLVLNQVTLAGAFDVSGQFALYCEDAKCNVSDLEIMALS